MGLETQIHEMGFIKCLLHLLCDRDSNNLPPTLVSHPSSLLSSRRTPPEAEVVNRPESSRSCG